MNALRNIGIISRLTLVESARRQGFLVLLLLALALLLGATALARFDQQVQRKMLADLCLAAIFLMGSLITVTTIVPLLPGEIEHKTLYPVLAKPVTRWQMVAGKYLGGMTAVGAGMAAMTVAVALLEWRYVGRVDTALGFVIPFYFLEAVILGAVALWLSTFLSTPWPGSCRCWSACWGTSKPRSTAVSWATRSPYGTRRQSPSCIPCCPTLPRSISATPSSII